MKINDVAKYLIYLACEDKIYLLTPLKLQKLLYYSQGLSFVWDNKELFKEEFEAWQYGPVNREVYLQYRKYGEYQIPYIEGKIFSSPKDEINTIKAVWRDFKKFNAYELVEMTHIEGPWKEAYSSENYRISNASIKKYFKRVYA
ncbi:DUF4065 domain-containing protein [Clostridium estertheticum]|uniref:Panacea domain-containing protein n=1 Tax=Clostridium estertheticum TaxID=238834 RepID=UPI001C0B45FD|nr:type II toxin-antitoxin system antitoxin SocA domain-containing protein [Clostridium estertheticum]MBU3198158.1 DUF4065 domain-containing protein [Clostridium estertheticum]WAG65949.1 DUF4065 domain-containing protein [Clostridium estertheticum]